jgi:hypothetical protein
LHICPPCPASLLVGIEVNKVATSNAGFVAEVVTNSAERKDRPAPMRGRIIRHNAGIFGRNSSQLRKSRPHAVYTRERRQR